MAEPSKGTNLVKLAPEHFTWHKDCHLFSKKIPYDTWQVPNWYPLGITRGKKWSPGVSKNRMPASVGIPFGEMLTGLVPSVKASANTLHKMSTCLCFGKQPPIVFPIFFQRYPVVISLIFMEKKKKKKTSEQICKAYTYLYIWSTHKELTSQRCTVQTSVRLCEQICKAYNISLHMKYTSFTKVHIKS